METIFMNTENSKTNEPHKFALNLSQRLDFKPGFPIVGGGGAWGKLPPYPIIFFENSPHQN